MKRVILLSVLCGSLRSQSLQILPLPPTGGDSGGAFQIMIVSAPPNSPASLQWRILTREDLKIDPEEVRPGAAAEGAKKSIRCAASKSETERSVICVVFGGVQRIPNGPVAIVPTKATQAIQSAVVTLESILGATPDAKPVWFRDVTATLPLRAEGAEQR